MLVFISILQYNANTSIKIHWPNSFYPQRSVFQKNFFGLNSRYLSCGKLFLQITVEFWVAGHLSLPQLLAYKNLTRCVHWGTQVRRPV